MSEIQIFQQFNLKPMLKQLIIMYQHGKDKIAENLLRDFFFALAVMKFKDFWNYLYKWINKVNTLFELRKIKLENEQNA